MKIKAKIASQFSDEDEHNEEFHTVFHIPHNKKRVGVVCILSSKKYKNINGFKTNKSNQVRGDY